MPKRASIIRVPAPAVKPTLPAAKVEIQKKILQPSSVDSSLNGLALPMGESSVSGGMQTSSWLLYGVKRIGKSSLAARFPGAIVFKFEIASQRVKSVNVDCPSWGHFLRYIELLRTEKAQHGDAWKREVAVIDTPFEAYARCKEYVCKKNGITYTSDDKAYGGIWDKISAEFRRAHMELTALGLGLIIVCHDEVRECSTRAGQKFDMVIPKLSKQADDLYRAIIENVIYYHYRDKQRWMTIRGSDYIFAGVTGDADDPVFLTPSGAPIYAVYAGETSQQAFTNLKTAYECRQEETYAEETEQYAEQAVVDAIRAKATKKAFNR
jgi:hypothetical protein